MGGAWPAWVIALALVAAASQPAQASPPLPSFVLPPSGGGAALAPGGGLCHRHRLLLRLAAGGRRLAGFWARAGRGGGSPGVWGGPHGGGKKLQEFRSNDGLIYLRNFLPREDFEAVLAECRGLKGGVKAERSSFAQGRLGTYLDKSGPTSRALLNRDVARRLEAVTGEEELRPSDYPVETRVYPVGSLMEWHRDELLYARPQYELVLTVINTGDSVTQWRDAQGRIQEQATEPNSLLVIKAGAAEHRVTPSKRGDRQIVKAVFCCCNDKLPAFEETMRQF